MLKPHHTDTHHCGQPQPLRCSLGSFFLWSAVLICAADQHAVQGQPPNPVAPPPAFVTVTTAVEREARQGQTFVGSITPTRRSAVGSAVDGRVVQFLVNEGDFVQARQPLAQLLTETISLQIAAAEGELRLRNAELLELQNGALAEEVQQAKSRYESAAAVRRYTDARYQRIKALFEQSKVVTQDEIQVALSNFEQADHNLNEASASLKLVEQGPRTERIAQAQARVDLQEANVNQLKDQLKKHTMIAPFDGYVVAEHTELGQWISRGELVATIAELTEVDVQAYVLESQVIHLTRKLEVRVEVPALAGEVFTGYIERIVPDGDMRSRTFPVKVRVPNQAVSGVPKLKPGMLARVTLPVGPTRRGTFVPKDAIVLGGPRPIVLTVVPSTSNPVAPVANVPPGMTPGQAVPIPVELGITYEGQIEVIGDLLPGTLVVTQGNERLRPGQAVIHGPPQAPAAAEVIPPPASTTPAAPSQTLTPAE